MASTKMRRFRVFEFDGETGLEGATTTWIYYREITDSAQLVTGISQDAASGAGDFIRVVEQLGQQVTIKSDGTGTLVPGDPLTSSGASAGRAKKATAGGAPIISRSLSTVAASADAATTALYGKDGVV